MVRLLFVGDACRPGVEALVMFPGMSQRKAAAYCMPRMLQSSELAVYALSCALASVG
jgi:hypothetical protein